MRFEKKGGGGVRVTRNSETVEWLNASNIRSGCACFFLAYVLCWDFMCVLMCLGQSTGPQIGMIANS